MATYTSLSALYKGIQRDLVEKAVTRTSDDFMKLIQDYMQEYFYGKYTPNVYERTYQMLRSITRTHAKTVGNTTTIEIYLDESAANYKYPDTGKIFELSADGFHGTYQSDYDYWEMAMDEIKATYKNYLRKHGLNVI